MSTLTPPTGAFRIQNDGSLLADPTYTGSYTVNGIGQKIAMDYNYWHPAHHKKIAAMAPQL